METGVEYPKGFGQNPAIEEALDMLASGRGGAGEVDLALGHGLASGDQRVARALLDGPFGEEPEHLSLLANRISRIARLVLRERGHARRLEEIALFCEGSRGDIYLLRRCLLTRRARAPGFHLENHVLGPDSIKSLPKDVRKTLRVLKLHVGLEATLGLAVAVSYLAVRLGPRRLPGVTRSLVLAARRGRLKEVGHLLETPAAFLMRELSEGDAAGQPLFWPGLGAKKEIQRFLRLVDFQAREPQGLFELGREASQALGRPVLMLFNASLGASAAWGMPGFHLQVGRKEGERLARRAKRAERSAFCRIKRERPLARLMRSLLTLARKRLTAPGLARSLRDLEALARVRGRPPYLDSPLAVEARVLAAGESPGRFAPRARTPGLIEEEIRILVNAHRARVASARRLFSLLGGLLVAAAKQPPGRGLVVPWVDKFFISSKRAGDVEYLIKVCRVVKRLCPETVIMLVDDTRRARDPSLKLAIQRINSRGFHARGLRGLGAPGEPLEAILREGPKPLFYAMRPFSDTHNPGTFDEILGPCLHDFLTPESYDSSWKDGLSSLYTGTDVEAYAERPLERDPAPFLFTDGGVLPAGAFWRRELKKRAVSGFKGPGGPLESIWRRWEDLAGLR